ncbi:MAG: hypothetical protein IJQ33_09765, partial [Clostridia bacterium]|nr:hypothetical protein [Clostridia bacterium]
KPLILRPEIDIGSKFHLPAHGLPARPTLKTGPRAGFPGASDPGDVHAAACGIEIEGLRPFDASQGFLTVCAAALRGGGFYKCKKARAKVLEKGARLTEKSVYAMISMCFGKYLSVFRRLTRKRRQVFGG